MEQTKTITLQQYTENWLCSYANDLGMDAKEEAEKILANEESKADCVEKFKKFSENFCEDRNRMNKGIYKLVSFDCNTLVYTITK